VSQDEFQNSKKEQDKKAAAQAQQLAALEAKQAKELAALKKQQKELLEQNKMLQKELEEVSKKDTVVASDFTKLRDQVNTHQTTIHRMQADEKKRRAREEQDNDPHNLDYNKLLQKVVTMSPEEGAEVIGAHLDRSYNPLLTEVEMLKESISSLFDENLKLSSSISKVARQAEAARDDQANTIASQVETILELSGKNKSLEIKFATSEAEKAAMQQELAQLKREAKERDTKMDKFASFVAKEEARQAEAANNKCCVIM
jgi:hypothetical protein